MQHFSSACNPRITGNFLCFLVLLQNFMIFYIGGGSWTFVAYSSGFYIWDCFKLTIKNEYRSILAHWMGKRFYHGYVIHCIKLVFWNHFVQQSSPEETVLLKQATDIVFTEEVLPQLESQNPKNIEVLSMLRKIGNRYSGNQIPEFSSIEEIK